MGHPHLTAQLLLELSHTVNEGLILLEGEGKVTLWNRWLAERTGIPAAQTHGRTLTEVFPHLHNSRLTHAVDTALRQRLPAILSQSLNRRPFPLRDPMNPDAPPLEQAITIAPLSGDDDEPHCLIQIQDVTAAVRREKQLREQAQQLHQLSNIDGLTGVANRRNFDTRFQEEFQRAQRHGTAISVLMLDIDYFKEYNDTYGHQAGDTCLTVVANTLRRCLQRGGDFVARYGGEEFAVVLPGCDHRCAFSLAETLKQQVSQLGMPHAASNAAPQLTISVGAASITPSRQARAVDLLRSADAALYQAKRLGRDRVVCADPADAAPAPSA
ncbi:MAG TPA: diguanylate cyclase [Azospira sp.]|nr:diguanylate cyclase [Azospira sp.]